MIHWKCHRKSEAFAQHCSIKMMFCILHNFHRKTSVMGSLFGKNVSPRVCNCTKKEAITGVFPWIDFANTFFWFIYSSIHSDMFYKTGLVKIFGKLTGKHLYQSFFSWKCCTPSSLHDKIYLIYSAEICVFVVKNCFKLNTAGKL